MRDPRDPRTGYVGSNGPVARGGAVFLYPGMLFASRTGEVVTTILGTCVSVCLFDAARGIGGLNHFMLPDRIGPAAGSARFGTVALEQLLEKMDALGAPRTGLRAKVFGGMSRREVASESSALRDIGTANVQLALELLEKQRIPVVARDTGGEHGRKIIFQTLDGTVWVRNL